ncbi:MAG: DUF2493 domain-containing protein [Blastocatellia bacterium]|nr:DUF2493 domain-containing protein [Blastocatellia bacterium]
MRILVSGGRDFDDEDLVWKVLGEYVRPRDVIVHGAARGLDHFAAYVGWTLGADIEAHPADWSHGKQGGAQRNSLMVSLGADLVLVFPGGMGTQDLYRKAKSAGLQVVRVG